MNAARHMADIAAMRRLAGRQEPLHERTAATVRAIKALDASTTSWAAFPPRRAALDAAVIQADAIARSLRELRETQSVGGQHG